MPVSNDQWVAVALEALNAINENLERKAAKGARLTMTRDDVDGLGLAITALELYDNDKEGQADG